MNGSLAVQRLEVRSDVQAFVCRIDELAGLVLSAATTDANLIARAAVALHHAYCAIEAGMARVARVFGTEPSGINWHRSLLETMAMEVPGLRPAVLRAAAVPDLREILSFRHFFRDAYQVALDPVRLSSLRDRAVAVRPMVVEDFEQLDRWLEALASAT
ncbi:MAG: hypothetical protein IPK26_27795 [Planctomycetes bacterium]|nr:hypothetical protein [Planctomycetota bacterium]